MLENLVSLSKKFGFESKFFSSKPWKFSNNERMRYVLWLIEFYYFINKNHDYFIFQLPCEMTDESIEDFEQTMYRELNKLIENGSN